METHYSASWKPEIQFSAVSGESVLRLRKVENALLSLYFSGYQVSGPASLRLNSYVSGELSWEDAFAEFYGIELANQEAEQWAQYMAAAPKTDTQWPD